MIKIGDEIFTVTLGGIHFEKGMVGKIVETREGKTYHFEGDECAVIEISEKGLNSNNKISETSVKALRVSLKRRIEELLNDSMDNYFSKLEEKT